MKFYSLLVLLMCYYIGQSIDPVKEYVLTPEDYDLEYHQLKIQTPEQCDLNTWIFEPKGKGYKGATVIIAGSDAGNMSHNLRYASQLINEGYRVVTFDYRGFGDSTDFQFNPEHVYHEEYIDDFVAVMDWSQKEYPGEKIGVMAFSMGTFIATAGYSRSSFDFLVAEGLVTSPVLIKERIKNIKNKELSLPKNHTNDIEASQNYTAPLLVFAAEHDKITTQKDSIEYCQNRSNARIKSYAGDHLRGALTLGMPSYSEEIFSFIEDDNLHSYRIREE